TRWDTTGCLTAYVVCHYLSVTCHLTVHFLPFKTRGDKHFTNEFYSDQISTMKEIFKTKSQSFDVSLSVKLKPTESNVTADIGGSFHAGKSTNMSDFLKKSKGMNPVYLHVKSNIYLGTFQMRKRDLRLSETFLEDLKFLPSTYEKGEYCKFLETYGTHYAQKGTIGGKYELMYVLDNQTLSSHGLTTGDVNECLGFNLGLTITADIAEAKSEIKAKQCKTGGFKNGTMEFEQEFSGSPVYKMEKAIPCHLEDDSSKSLATSDIEKMNFHNLGKYSWQKLLVDDMKKSGVIQDVVSLIQGGTTATLTKLNELLSSNVKLIDVEQYVEWAATLPQAPTVIRQEIAPISELVPLKIPDSRIKKENLDRAVEDYVAEYSVCKCQPCLHGGTAMLIEGKCECACTPFYKGEACEIPKSSFIPAQTAIDGSWSCWSNWSTCQNGERQRARECNNPAPGFGGKSCPGATVEPGYC
ncbi:hypothetical protein Chor_007991, partial [Crotalus horridus]